MIYCKQHVRAGQDQTNTKISLIRAKNFSVPALYLEKIRQLQSFGYQNLSKPFVSDTTFYRHYHGLNDLFQQNQANLLEQLEQFLASDKTKNLSQQEFITRLLILIYRNRTFVDILVRMHNVELGLIVMSKIRPILTKNWSIYDRATNQRIYTFFSAEFITEIALWAVQENFNFNTVESHAQHLQNFTTTACQRFKHYQKITK